MKDNPCHDVHVQRLKVLLKAQVLHNIGMIEVAENTILISEGVDDLLQLGLQLIAGCHWLLNLFDGHELAGGCVERKVHSAIAAFAQ